jgi:hypothetical protein
VIGPNAVDKDLNDLSLMFNDRVLATVSVGLNTDGTVFISYVKFRNYPNNIAKLFGVTEEPAK